MLWTLFMFLMVVWIAGLGLRLGGSVIHLLLVLAGILLLMKLLIHRTSFN
jgi:hypothetical protein